MALFLDTADLLARIRATEIPTTTDAYAIIEEAMRAARVRMILRLGEDRVAELLSTGLVDEPTTEAQVLRALAAGVEKDIVMLHVVQNLPGALMDASGNIHKRWNEEAPFRERPVKESELARRELEIEKGLAILAGDIEDGCGIQVYVSGSNSSKKGPNSGWTLKGLGFQGPFKRGPYDRRGRRTTGSGDCCP